MQKRFQARLFLRVGEHQIAHALAVHRTRRVHERAAEKPPHFRNRSAAGAGQLMAMASVSTTVAPSRENSSAAALLPLPMPAGQPDHQAQWIELTAPDTSA